TPLFRSRVCRLAVEGVLHADQTVRTLRTPRHTQVARHVREEHGVHVFEQAVPHEICLRSNQLFRGARPQHDRTLHSVALHDLLHGKRGNDVHSLPAVVPFAVTWLALHDRLSIGNSGLLGCLRNAVDVRAECDYGRPRAPLRHPRRGHVRDAALHGEALALQKPGQIPGSFHFLVAELTEAEPPVHDLLHHLRALLHLGYHALLERGDPGRILRRWLGDPRLLGILSCHRRRHERQREDERAHAGQCELLRTGDCAVERLGRHYSLLLRQMKRLAATQGSGRRRDWTLAVTGERGHDAHAPLRLQGYPGARLRNNEGWTRDTMQARPPRTTPRGPGLSNHFVIHTAVVSLTETLCSRAA